MPQIFVAKLNQQFWLIFVEHRAVSRTDLGEYIFIHSCSALPVVFKSNSNSSISKEICQAKHEYMNINPQLSNVIHRLGRAGQKNILLRSQCRFIDLDKIFFYPGIPAGNNIILLFPTTSLDILRLVLHLSRQVV